jgi:hypothetical protein
MPEMVARGARRVDYLGAYADLGVSRLQVYLDDFAGDDASIETLAEDARAAGVALEPAS